MSSEEMPPNLREGINNLLDYVAERLPGEEGLRLQVEAIVTSMVSYDDQQPVINAIMELFGKHHCASCGMHSCGDLERPAPLFPADSRDLDMTAPKACAWCQVEFVDGDKIIPVPTLGAEGWHVIGWHPECELRSRAGSPAHLRGTCAVVCGGDGSEDDSGPLTPEESRAEALETWRIVKGS